MRFLEFQNQARALQAFNLNDIRKIDPNFHRQQLTYWINKAYITPLAGGYYKLAQQSVNENYLFMLANRLYSPSYISLESALAYYQVIPETVLGVTSVSSRKTTEYASEWGRFTYRSIRPLLMIGYHVVETNQGIKYKIANLEKAVLDYLYLNPQMTAVADFEALRWNQVRLQELDQSRLKNFLRIFGSQALVARTEVLMEYVDA